MVADVERPGLEFYFISEVAISNVRVEESNKISLKKPETITKDPHKKGDTKKA